ncbi:putative transmembrane protein [Caballeronia sordidicola]|uniref:Putative transmembrane protein n=1 Tax=Caballeronia sordidicola TaxID=196367 RepID=A0A226WXB4_CABSO|nr:putative transmembrane protein [Caballeronia sordidicola]
MLIEASLLLCFGLLGSHLLLWETLFGPTTVVVLGFIVGLQNAIIAKLRGADIPYRTPSQRSPPIRG